MIHQPDSKQRRSMEVQAADASAADAAPGTSPAVHPVVRIFIPGCAGTQPAKYTHDCAPHHNTYNGPRHERPLSVRRSIVDAELYVGRLT